MYALKLLVTLVLFFFVTTARALPVRPSSRHKGCLTNNSSILRWLNLKLLPLSR
jgi:hypothetical protein